MSQEHGANTEHKPHVLPLRVYIGVWVGLLVLSVITVKASYFDFGMLNLGIAMAIATVKATLVLLYFMHLKYDEGFNAIVFASSLAFLGIFLVFTLADTVERGRIDPIEADLIEPVPARPELWDIDHEAGHDDGVIPDSGGDAPGDSQGGSTAPSDADHSGEDDGSLDDGSEGEDDGSLDDGSEDDDAASGAPEDDH